MSDYRTGHVMHNPSTNEVAIRTIFPEDQSPAMASLAWLIATTSMGSRSVRSAEIFDYEGWVDLYVPPAPETQAPVEMIDTDPPTGPAAP